MNEYTKAQKQGYQYAVVAEYAFTHYEKGQIVSRHRTYQAAEKASKKGGYESFKTVRAISDYT